MAYKKDLAKKVKDIFSLQQVVFGPPVGTKTQKCAWIIPADSKMSIVGGYRTFFVTGEIMIINPLDAMPVGRLYELYQLSRKKNKTPGKFIVTGKVQEGFDHGANQLTAQKFEFIFEITQQYNPPKPMRGLRWIYNIIGKQNV